MIPFALKREISQNWIEFSNSTSIQKKTELGAFQEIHRLRIVYKRISHVTLSSTRGGEGESDWASCKTISIIVASLGGGSFLTSCSSLSGLQFKGKKTSR